MNSLKSLFLISTLITLSSCSGGKGGSSLSSLFDGNDTSTSESSNNPIPDPPPSEVETFKLQAAIQAEPEYRIENSELESLKADGIIAEEDIEKIKAIQ